MSVSPAKARLLEKRDDNIVIVSVVRSAITNGKKGGFKDTKPDHILSNVLHAAYKCANLNPKLIDDISVGNILPPGGGASAARMAALHVGIPKETSINTMNRQCSSGLTAVNQIVNEIRVGQIKIGIGAGVESMTFGYSSTAAADVSDKVLSNPSTADCLLPMGITSENDATDFGVPCQVQAEFAACSYAKVAKVG